AKSSPCRDSSGIKKKNAYDTSCPAGSDLNQVFWRYPPASRRKPRVTSKPPVGAIQKRAHVMRHVVHCSGYSLAERSGVRPIVTNQQGLEVKGKFFDWDIVCLGHPDLGIYGRIPMAVHLAESLRAECLIWSTGATYLSGVSEAEFMMNTGHDYLTR